MSLSIESVKWIEENTGQTLAERLAADVAGLLRDAIEERGRATLVVSGGSTPVPFFIALRDQPLEWQKVSVTLADERWVESSHQDSNERLLREHLLLADPAAPAANCQVVGLYCAGTTPDQAEAQCGERIQALLHKPSDDQGNGQFDVVILGMGGDGHTASLFPNTVGLAEALEPAAGKLCKAMDPPVTEQRRMTLTLRALLSTRKLVLHITGQSKLDVLSAALQAGDPLDKPITAVFQAGDPVVYWSKQS